MPDCFVCSTGLEICLGQPVNETLLRLIQNELQTVSDSLAAYEEKTDEKIKKLCDTFHPFRSEFDRALEQVIKRLEKQQKELKEQKEKLEQVNKRLGQLETNSKGGVSPSADYRPVVFDAPDQNCWFTGREKEMEILEECLPFESDKGLKISAIWGLGGCGKTTLAAQFAWKRKSEYEGGVFWISMEDDDKFRNSINDLALRWDLMEDSQKFDLTLSKVLAYISQQKKPWLMVTDNVDQLTLSNEMRRVLSGRWKRHATGHLLLTTRREAKEVCEWIDLNSSCCVELCSFSEDNAKSFLVKRIGVDATKQDELLRELAKELGCLPLALEQASAHIKTLQCPINTYLEEYRRKRGKLLNERPAKSRQVYEHPDRSSVHTTWLMNIDYIKESPQGKLASKFVQAAAFMAPDNIMEDLIDCDLIASKDPTLQTDKSTLSAYQVVEVVTKFSLFQRKSESCLGMHRMVQEFIRSNLSEEDFIESLELAIELVIGILTKINTAFVSMGGKKVDRKMLHFALDHGEEIMQQAELVELGYYSERSYSRFLSYFVFGKMIFFKLEGTSLAKEMLAALKAREADREETLALWTATQADFEEVLGKVEGNKADMQKTLAHFKARSAYIQETLTDRKSEAIVADLQKTLVELIANLASIGEKRTEDGRYQYHVFSQ